MAILFYDHLVDKSDVWMYIERINGPESQKSRLKRMVDDILHNGVLEMLLQKLAPHHHEQFLRLVTNAPYDPIVLEFLKQHADEHIELEIENHGRNLISSILKDFQKK